MNVWIFYWLVWSKFYYWCMWPTVQNSALPSQPFRVRLPPLGWLIGNIKMWGYRMLFCNEKTGILIYNIIWMILGNTTVSKRIQSQTIRYCMISLVQKPQQRHACRSRNQIRNGCKWAQGYWLGCKHSPVRLKWQLHSFVNNNTFSQSYYLINN